MHHEIVPVLPCPCPHKYVVVRFLYFFKTADIVLQHKAVKIFCKQNITAATNDQYLVFATFGAIICPELTISCQRGLELGHGLEGSKVPGFGIYPKSVVWL